MKERGVVLITGGSRGIGLGLARGLAEAGANLVLTARNADELAAAQRELAPLGVNVQIAPFDVAQVAQIAGFYNDVVTRFGPIDILITGTLDNYVRALDPLYLGLFWKSIRNWLLMSRSSRTKPSLPEAECGSST